MMLAVFLFLLFAVLSAVGAGWIAYSSRGPWAALGAAVATLITFALLGLGLVWLVETGLARSP